MKSRRVLLCVCLLSGLCAGMAAAQEAGVEPETPTKAGPMVAPAQATAVRLLRYSAALKDAAGTPRTGMVGVTFALYAEREGATPLWLETQNVTLDEQGRYTALLGVTSNEGLPLELFSMEEARWLGIQVQGEPEQARVLLVSVPYALKAADAEMLGGKPLSAFVLSESSEAAGEEPVDDPKVQVNGSGTTNRVAKFTATDTIGDSQLFDNGTNVGIGTTTPTNKLQVNGNIRLIGQTTHQVQVTGVLSSGRLGQDNSGFFFASDTPGRQLNFFTNAGAGIQRRLTITADGNVGIGTATPAEKVHIVGNLRLDSLLDLGTDACSALSAAGRGRLCFNGTKFRISENGGAYQDLGGGGGGGSGDITAVNAGTGLTGGGDTGDVTLNVDFAGPGAATTVARSDHTHALAGMENTGVGENALANNSSGILNTAVGAFALDANTSGVGNTALGSKALGANQIGNNNTALGTDALLLNTNDDNTAVGSRALDANTSGSQNTAVGRDALGANFSGQSNTAVGVSALSENQGGTGNTAVGRRTLMFNTVSFNTAVGADALMANTSGTNNTAVGAMALDANTDGGQNTALGASALGANSSGSFNTAIGLNALVLNTTGSGNTAVGANAMELNLSAFGNTAVGEEALSSNQTGASNTAVGRFALRANVADDNTALGSLALVDNTTGTANTGVGTTALQTNLDGSNNTGVGFRALWLNTSGAGNVSLGAFALNANAGGSNNTAVGMNALGSNSNTSGSNNIALGASAGSTLTTGDNNIYIGHPGAGAEANTMRIGGTQTATFIAGILNQSVDSATDQAVLIDGTGKLGTVASTRRAKEDIHDMGEASAGLQRLRPVVFRYRKPLADGSKPLQYGLIAEEVAEVMPELVVYEADGQPQTVKYHLLPALLLNELQHQQAEQQRQQSELAALRALVSVQADELARLREQVEQVKALLTSEKSVNMAAAALAK